MILGISALFAPVFPQVNDNAAMQPVVETASGKVQGFIEEGTMAFKGIPYARTERFMPPMPVDRWEGVRLSTEWGPRPCRADATPTIPRR